MKDLLPKVVDFMAAKQQLHQLAQVFYESFYAYDRPGLFNEDTSSCLKGIETRLVFCAWPLMDTECDLTYQSSVQSWLISQSQYFISGQQPSSLLWSLMLEAYLEHFEQKLAADYTIETLPTATHNYNATPSSKSLVDGTLCRIEAYLGCKNIHLKNILLSKHKLKKYFDDQYVRSLLQDVADAGYVDEAYQNYFMTQDKIIDNFKDFISDDKIKFQASLEAWKAKPINTLSKINGYQKVRYTDLRGYLSKIEHISYDILEDIYNEVWSDEDLAQALFGAIKSDLEHYIDILINKNAHLALEKLGDTSVVILACQNQNLRLLEILMTYPISFNFKRCKDGMNGLMYAARYYPESLPVVLNYCFDAIDDQDHDGKTALHHAQLGSQYQSLGLLLKNGANSSIRDKNNASVLHIASSNADWQSIDILLSHDADPTLKDHNDRNFAHILLAECQYHTSLEDIIVSNKLNRFDLHGKCLLHYALEQNHDDLCIALIDQGLSLFHSDHSKSCIDYIIRKQKLTYIERILYHPNLPNKDYIKKAMVFDAIRYKNRRYYKLIVQELDILNTRLNNKTILQFAYQQQFDICFVDLIRPENRTLINVSTAMNPSVLFMAISESDESTVRACLRAGASANICFNQKHPLHKAIEVGNERIIKHLLNAPHNQSWQSLLPVLNTKQHAKITKKVYTHLATPEQSNLLLHELIKTKHTTLFASVIKICTNMVDTIDKEGRTPLILAIQKQQLCVIQTLLEHNVDIRHKDNKHHCALHYACQSPNPEIRQLLDSYRHTVSTIHP